ncbi:ribosome maturation factor RimP [Corynebacterium sp.]|uniref:ribosome maturation factor RimP n=1 Tax=Corynebacterium sp. TaxID=1720 RepID=UPI002A9125E0|nr:ribosome maturation factor RimP [Corynebacterium sp.]MDY5785199.1 ribosome maturation factor RimP [Corynebacterium sp.]
MAFPAVETLTELIRPLAGARGMDVENVSTTKAGKKSQVVVALDSDSRPTLDELEVMSQEIGELFDAKEDAGELNFGAGYTLEVTTPGVGLPLTQPRHWRRNHGRLVVMGERTVRVGALDETETHVVLVEAGAKDPRVTIEVVSDLPHAVVEVEFNNPPETESRLVNMTFEEAREVASNGEEDK